ncbi:arsenate reductase/protein-tyrosine-phosphatase family protein [Nakamurella endophytica]|uniref:arsenate reductase/protein-tyrosine-phosphatase family protein n=1 Tax=Nakamurella endophytica TaxID=1748367 RepID=UPI001669F636|nr:hypothetical protein [Nakamurella endophytica]
MVSHRSTEEAGERAGAVADGFDDFRVLLVCTANLCRSPMGQFLLDTAVSAAWAGHGRWIVGSAGVLAADNRPMHRRAAKVLADHGIDGSRFRSRRLRPSLLESADLVLTATRDHRAEAARLHPPVLRKLFTVNQFAYLLAHSPVPPPAQTAAEAGRSLIDAAVAARGRVQARTVEDDLADPVDRPLRAFRECAQILSRDVAQFQRLLAQP